MGKQDKRIRNTAKDLFKQVTEEHLNPRLDQIEAFCQKSLKEQNDRSGLRPSFGLGRQLIQQVKRNAVVGSVNAQAISLGLEAIPLVGEICQNSIAHSLRG